MQTDRCAARAYVQVVQLPFPNSCGRMAGQPASDPVAGPRRGSATFFDTRQPQAKFNKMQT